MPCIVISDNCYTFAEKSCLTTWQRKRLDFGRVAE